MNFTPSACSLIVLNVVMQNQHIFKDARNFNQFKKHCSALKANLESAPKPANAINEANVECTPPPKGWIYCLSDSANLNTDLEQAKLNDLDSLMVDPLENLIGFYAVVGRKPTVGAPT